MTAEELAETMYWAQGDNALLSYAAAFLAMREALRLAHDCATLDDDGSCKGCYLSEALAQADALLEGKHER